MTKQTVAGLALCASAEPEESIVASDAQKTRDILLSMIRASMRDVGSGSGTEEEVERAYACMRAFSIDAHPEFYVRLDYIDEPGDWGYGTHSRLSIDSVFAYLLYLRHAHVLTMGFSIARGKRLLIGNVQAPRALKGWGLQFLPKRRLEYIIDAFAQAFPEYELYLIDIDALVERLLATYQRHQNAARDNLTNGTTQEARTEAEENIAYFGGCIEHLKAERGRLRTRYADTGRYGRAGTALFADMKYHRLVRA